LKFFNGRRPNLKIAASFETNPEKFGRLIHGCPCHSIDNAETIIREQCITVGIVAVPDEEAQFVANVFVEGGVRGILNFARTPLHVPTGVYVEDIDLAMSMDRVSYFSRQSLKLDEAALTMNAVTVNAVNKESNS
jgi:redox-sensing transcriptional repressor